jgi:hypothetical protein
LNGDAAVAADGGHAISAHCALDSEARSHFGPQRHHATGHAEHAAALTCSNVDLGHLQVFERKMYLVIFCMNRINKLFWLIFFTRVKTLLLSIHSRMVHFFARQNEENEKKIRN